MVKSYGLLIGVTYPNTQMYLPGCDNDVLEIYKFLKGSGYEEFDVLCDTDIFKENNQSVSTRLPTFRNIVGSLFNMVRWARRNPSGKVFLHYSGHGTQVSDNNWVFDRNLRRWRKEEDDGRDECMVAGDMGLIRDDQLKWLFSYLPASTNLFSLMDSCHSGSAFDLKYYLKSANETVTKTIQGDLRANVLMLSGCKDEQFSESSVFEGKWYGVMSYAFLNLMDYMKKYDIQELSVADFWRYMGIICNDYPQIPQASCSKNEFNSMKITCKNGVFDVVKSQTRTRELTLTDEGGKSVTVSRNWKMSEPLKQSNKPLKKNNNYLMKMK